MKIEVYIICKATIWWADVINLLTSIKTDPMYTIVITGGTVLIGNALAKALLEKGHRVIILSRKPAGKPIHENLRYAAWNVKEQIIDPAIIGAADHIIH